MVEISRVENRVASGVLVFGGSLRESEHCAHGYGMPKIVKLWRMLLEASSPARTVTVACALFLEVESVSLLLPSCLFLL
jgi:hypothetical protein